MKNKTRILLAGVACIATVAGLAACSEYDKLTGSTATPASVEAEAVPQTLSDLSSLAYDALTDYAPLVTAGNTQNGQDVGNALFAAAAKGVAATAAGQIITDAGGTALAPFASAVSTAITSGTLNKTATDADILNTVAAVVQNVTNSAAVPLPTVVTTGT